MSDAREGCDKCGAPAVWYTRYSIPIEEAIAMRERGLEPPAAEKLCRDCWGLSIVSIGVKLSTEE